jgi:hypothetical protein
MTFALVANYGGNNIGRIAGALRTDFNTGGLWQGKWLPDREYYSMLSKVWAAQWGDGFTHPSPGPAPANDVRIFPTALPTPTSIPEVSACIISTLRTKKVAVCMGSECKPRLFGVFVKRHVCKLCGSTVCGKCSRKLHGGGNRCHACQRLVDSPRWSGAYAERFANAIKSEADCTPLVVRTLGGDRHVVAGGSGWATATDLLQFVVKAVPALRALGGPEQLALMAGSAVVDPQFYTSEVRAQIALGELPAEVVVVVLAGSNGSGGDDKGCGGGGAGGGPARLLSMSTC